MSDSLSITIDVVDYLAISVTHNHPREITDRQAVCTGISKHLIYHIIAVRNAWLSREKLPNDTVGKR